MTEKPNDQPRTLLESWREQNRTRDGEPSRLLQQLRAEAEGLQRFAQSAHGRELRDSLLRMQESTVGERLMGRMRPASPDLPVKQKQKRKSGGGRKRILTPEQITQGIHILRSQSRMSIPAACATLRAAGIEGGDTVLYERVVKPAYASQ